MKLLKEIPGTFSILCVEETDEKGVRGCHCCWSVWTAPRASQAVDLGLRWVLAHKEPRGDWKSVGISYFAALNETFFSGVSIRNFTIPWPRTL